MANKAILEFLPLHVGFMAVQTIWYVSMLVCVTALAPYLGIVCTGILGHLCIFLLMAQTTGYNLFPLLKGDHLRYTCKLDGPG